MKNTLIALGEFAGPLNQLMTNLTGEEWEIWWKEFKKFLRKEECWTVSTFRFLTRIKVGNGPKTKLDFISALGNAKIQTGTYSKKLLESPDFLKDISFVASDVDLYCATTEELTGKKSATTAEVFDAIKRIGKLCTAEVSLQLRLQYRNVPNNDSLYVAMVPVHVINQLSVLVVGKGDNGEWLSAHNGEPDTVWVDEMSPWVFVL